MNDNGRGPGQPHTPGTPGPLAGLRIVDLTTVIMGPYATQILADYGADVIKVESPEGDVMRTSLPARSPGMGSIYLQVNRNKRSIVLDLKREAGRDVLLRLCRTADVVISNIRPAAMRRLRLADADLRAVNPRLINVSLVGYGQDGPYARKPAYDDLMQGISGVATLFVAAGGEEPRYVPLTMCDQIVGLNAVHVVLAAVIERDRTGQGQSVELPMFETMAQFVLSNHLAGRSFEPPVGKAGYNRLLTADRRPYRTRDGYVCVLIYLDKHWRGFMDAIGRGDQLKSDPRLATQTARARHFDVAYAMVTEVMRERTTAEWLELFERLDIPCVPLYDVDALIDDRHLAAVDFFQERDHPTEGRMRYTGIPGRWNGTRLEVKRNAPNIGEHSVEVLREAGLGEAEIGALLADGVTIDRAVRAQEEDRERA
jgi:crotonobetainyl-CoA:carnitine CoA-transferase CaiB-like acyl-CoA transferase